MDAELLIYLVEQKPLLWKVKSADYHNKDLKQAAWASIARELISDYEKQSVREMKKSIDMVSGRWKAIRDAYRRSLYSAKTKEYKHARFLSFLNSEMGPRRASVKFASRLETSQQARPSTPLSSPDNSQEARSSSPIIFLATPEYSSTLSPTPSPAISDSTAAPTYTTTTSYSHENSSIPSSTDRSTHYFFMSLAADFSKVDPQLQSDCKIELLQTIANFLKQSNPNPSQPYFPESMQLPINKHEVYNSPSSMNLF